MSQPFERHTISFILRLWVEPMQSGESQSRGQIEHVGSGEKTHFHVPAAFVAFMARYLPASPEEGPANSEVGEEELLNEVEGGRHAQ